jgi:hypothetical protein
MGPMLRRHARWVRFLAAVQARTMTAFALARPREVRAPSPEGGSECFCRVEPVRRRGEGAAVPAR